MLKKLLFKDIFNYTAIYRSYVGGKWILFLITAIIPAILDGTGISMIIPLLNLVMDSPGTPNKGSNENSDLAYDLMSSIGLSVNLINILLVIAVIYIVKFFVGFSNGIFKSYMFANLVKGMRIKLYSRLMSMEYSTFKDKNTGYYTNLATTQMTQFLGGFLYLTNFYTKIIAAVAYLTFSFFIDLKFSLIAAVAGLMIVSLFKGFNSYIKILSVATAKQESWLTSIFIQVIQSFKYLASTSGFESFNLQYKDSVEKIKSQRLKSEIIRNLFDSSYEMLTVFFICFLILIQVVYFGNPLAPMLLSIFLFHRAVGNISITQKDWQFVLNVSGGIEAITREFYTTVNSTEKSGIRIIGELERIELNNLKFTYKHNPVISNLSLIIPAKKTIAIVGESGSGKSTLVDLLTLILKPVDGSIYINNVRHDEIELDSWRKRIGFVSQDIQLYEDTIANNISLWTADYNTIEGASKIEKAARLANCHEFISETEYGFQSWVGDRGLSLSGGQRQRIALARELFKEPDLLILDEATSALDSESEQYVKNTLNDLKGKLTIIMIAHRLSTVKDADLIVVLKNGTIEEMGTFDELNNKKGYFSEIVKYQKL